MESDSDSEVLETVLVLSLIIRRQRRMSKRRRMWVHGIFSQCQQRGEYHTLLQEMRLSDAQSHFSYLQMSKRFEDLQTMVGPLLARRNNYWSRMRANITPAKILALTIRYSSYWEQPDLTIIQFSYSKINSLLHCTRNM